MNKLISVIVASNRPEQLRRLFDNFRDMADEPGRIEMLVNIDEGDEAMLAVVKEAQGSYPFSVRYLQTPRMDGYYTLHIGYQKLFDMAAPESYFFTVFSDECRLLTRGFDTVLARYVGFFKDDLFRLKISPLRYRNYYNYQECGPCPENYPFWTRRWLEVTEGIGQSWGPDGWHQYVDFYAGRMETKSGVPGVFRSIPINDITLGGEPPGQGLSPESAHRRTHRIMQEWQRLYSHERQQNFKRLACHMAAYVWAHDAAIGNYRIEEDRVRRQVLLKDASGAVAKAFSWRISPLYVYALNFWRIYGYARTNNIAPLVAFVEPSTPPENPLLRRLNRYARMGLLILLMRKPSHALMQALSSHAA